MCRWTRRRSALDYTLYGKRKLIQTYLDIGLDNSADNCKANRMGNALPSLQVNRPPRPKYAYMVIHFLVSGLIIGICIDQSQRIY